MQHRFRGAALILIVTFLFALHDATSKYLTAFFAVPLLVWARYVGHLLIMLVGITPHMGWQIVATRRPGLMVMRASMLVAVSLLFQNALKTLPLAETSALIFATPLIVAVLAGPILGEKVRTGTWVATAAGFCGTLLIARPGGVMTMRGLAFGLGAALCFAVYQLFTRKLAETEPPMRQLFYTALVGSVVMSFIVPAYLTPELPTISHGALIFSLALTASVGHFLFTRAARETPAAILSTLLYMQLVWTVVLGWLVFDHLPDLPSFLGMLIIGGSSLSIALQRNPTSSTEQPSDRGSPT